jgi:hypothetical protein
MPYAKAPYFMLVVIGVILLGFWPSYFATFGGSAWQFHAHGVAASIWVLMVTLQSWSGQHKSRFALHRSVGQASLWLFPFLMAGLFAILDHAGKGFVPHNDPFRETLGGSFAIGVMVAAVAYVVLFYRALKFRRSVWVHAGYMLSTPLILFESPFSRVLGMFIPAFMVRGPQDIGRILPSILWSMALELAIVATLWLVYRGRAKPFLVAGGLIAAQMIAMGPLGGLPVWRTLLTAVGNAPSALIWAIGFAIGAATSWAGWQAGKRPTVPLAAAQPA